MKAPASGELAGHRASSGDLASHRVSSGELAAHRVSPGSLADLARGLAVAVSADGLVFLAFLAPAVDAATIVEAFPDDTAVAWSAAGLTLVGIGVARELRGEGPNRFEQVIDRARTLRLAGAILAEPAANDHFANDHFANETTLRPVSALGEARPRLLGGAAFAPGSAAQPPWTGFGDAWFVLPRWTYVRSASGARLVLAVDAREAAEIARWTDELARFDTCFTRPRIDEQPGVVELASADAATWRRQVIDITDAIRHRDCAKIVAARTCTVTLAAPARPAALLATLDRRHADCVRLLVRPPGGGTLVAASPERLVRRDGETVSCDALAGTVRLGASNGASAAAELVASMKDRREHQLVVTAIRDAFESVGAKVVAPTVPEIRALRHVLHLHTPFRATLGEPRHVLELVARLHPTPAVGGTPTALAVDWIASREPVARGWYSSPVGWFDLDGNGDFAVAIRSGVLDGTRAHLWAGAGIVEGSDPDRELAETELKLRAMLGALGVV